VARSHPALSLFFALPVVFILALGSDAEARPKFAKKEKVECSHCHLNRNGGGARNLIGHYYHAEATLPKDTSPAGMKRIQARVDEWLDEVAHTPPTLTWRHTPLAEMPGAPAPDYDAATDTAVLRRIALDLTGRAPAEEDMRALVGGSTSFDELVEKYLHSGEFSQTFLLYHDDLLRPRTGIFNQTASLSRLREVKGSEKGDRVFRSLALKGEEDGGDCDDDSLVRIVPYWERNNSVRVCRRTADSRRVVKRDDGTELQCGTPEGQASGECGCGPNLMFCHRDRDWSNHVKRQLVRETGKIAMEVVEKDMPYGTILTADWTMQNGRLDHFYSRLDGTLGTLERADTRLGFRRVERGPGHAGILTTHAFLNMFYNGRRWAQRTYETFICHKTFPDFDLLDENPEDALPVSYRRHPLAEVDVNVNSGRVCAACHLQLDGLSRLKDRWDNQGQFFDKGSDGQPIPNEGFFLGKKVHSLEEFGAEIAKSEVFEDCVVQQTWEHFLGRRFVPEDLATRRELNTVFKSSNQNFRELLRAVMNTQEYRAKDNIKIMERELYTQVMERITGVKWTVGERKRRGFGVFYDKVGGMDYRKIEERDRTPSQAHLLVLYKGAAETCDEVMERDRDRSDRRMLPKESWKTLAENETAAAAVDRWYRIIYGRPAADVDPKDKSLLLQLHGDIQKEFGTLAAYKATCTAMFGAADFALY